MWPRRGHPGPFEPQDRYYGLSEADFTILATYNAERARGLVHSDQWREQMSRLQSAFDAGQREREDGGPC